MSAPTTAAAPARSVLELMGIAADMLEMDGDFPSTADDLRESRDAVRELIEADRAYDEARKAWDALAPSGIGEVDERSSEQYEPLRLATIRRRAALAQVSP